MLREKNAAFKWVVTGTVTVLGLILTVPFLKTLFKFGSVTGSDFCLALAGALVAVVLMEIVKLFSLRGRPN